MAHHDSSSARLAPATGPVRVARVAVVIPCYNDPLVVEAAASVRQSPDAEIVVIDDGSTDQGTLESLDALLHGGIKVVRQENAGLSAARMAGLKATSAPYVYNLDADDLAASAAALGAMADRLDADPEATVCYGDYLEFGDVDLIRAVPPTIDPYRLAYTNEYPVTALFRRTALQAVGGWQHLGNGYEDWRLWMTLAERGCRGVYAGAGVLTYRRRLHGERMLGVAKADHRALYGALRRAHPGLFAEIAVHRRASSLSPLRKLLYPFVYGSRRRFRFERRVKAWLDRAGAWTLRG
jgi:glycosyltransferase involved in cell wall biosynthesis